MEVVETTDKETTVQLSFGHQTIKTVLSIVVASLAGKAVETAYDRFVEYRLNNRTVIETPEV